jgi:SagB-type dehydrogenase family enzyme
VTVVCRFTADVTGLAAEGERVTVQTVPFGDLVVGSDHPGLLLALRHGVAEAALAPVGDILARLVEGRLIEWLVTAADGAALVVVEARDSSFTPGPVAAAPAGAVLSRFAYFHREGAGLVLDSAAVPARARLDPARLSVPAVIDLLWRCGLMVAADAAEQPLWSLHDRLFHAMTRFGRDAEALGALDPGRGVIDPPPALAALPDGPAIVLPAAAVGPVLLRRRRSGREWSDEAIPLAALSALLAQALAVIEELPAGPDGLVRLRRPYPSGGALSALVAELAVDRVEGLRPGYYRYDETGHGLVAHRGSEAMAEAAIAAAAQATSGRRPAVLLRLTLRHDRVAWRYAGLPYRLALLEAGAALQALSLVAGQLGLAACILGTGPAHSELGQPAVPLAEIAVGLAGQS